MTRKKSAWTVFRNWLFIIIGSIGILFALFCVLTQWKFITVSTDGISVKEIYQGPNDIIIYRLNVPEGRYASTWKFEIKDDGSGYQIPKRSIIELHKNVVKSQLIDDEHFFDRGEMNHAQLVTGGPAITSWYIGVPDNAVLIWEEGMELDPAPYELLKECGLHILVDSEEINTEIGNPWTEWDSIKEAELATGFSFGLPEVIANSYNAVEIRTMNNELIEVIYLDGSFEVCVRKQKGEGQDISGDYNEYDICSEKNYNGGTITNYHNSNTRASKQVRPQKILCNRRNVTV